MVCVEKKRVLIRNESNVKEPSVLSLSLTLRMGRIHSMALQEVNNRRKAAIQRNAWFIEWLKISRPDAGRDNASESGRYHQTVELSNIDPPNDNAN